MTRPLVDVVVICHDYARYVGAAIDSALAQTEAPGRIVVVDDGSTDGSREVIAGYADRVTVVHRPCGGQAAAVNTGFARTSGDLVVFLDADDLLDPAAVAGIADAAAARPDVARVHWRMAVVDADGTPTGEVRPAPHTPLAAGDLRNTTLTTPFDAPWAAMSANAFRRDVLERLLPMPEGPRVGADWYLVHVSGLYGPVTVAAGDLGRYREHGGNAHARTGTAVDLDHLRATAGFAADTRQAIAEHSARIGRPTAPRAMASMSDAANRLIVLRLNRGRPALPGDTRTRLVRLGVRAARHRAGGRTFRALYVAWLVAMTVVPRRWAEPVAAAFLFPGRRRAAGRLLARISPRDDRTTP